MIVLTPNEMTKLDQKVIENGFESLLLMETAGRGTTEIIKENYNRDNKILILAGSGNNGGDGLVIGRLLDICKYNVKIIIVGKEDKLNQDPLTNYKICKLRNIELEFFHKNSDLKQIEEAVKNNDLIIDSLLGTGLTGELRSPYLEIVKLINESNKDVLAVDIPSGINGNNGHIEGVAVKADKTVTMFLPKLGNILFPGAEYNGKLIIGDIGIYKKIISNLDLNNNWNEVRKEFEEHFSEKFTDINENLLTYSKSGEKLIIEKNGKIRGEMPLHAASFKASKICFEQNQIRFISDNSEYIYKR